MSLLSTFGILFETDAKDASDEVERLSDTLDDTEQSAEGAAGGLDDVTAAANEGSASIGGLTRGMLGLVAAYVTFDTVASGIFENALEIDTIGKFSQTIGENIVEIDAWGEAVARNGGSADAFRGSVESLNTSLADIKISGGGETIDTLSRLGVTAMGSGGQIRSAFDILPELADSFQRLSAQESFAFGRKLGLDQGTILLLQQGRVAVEDLVERQKMLGGVTQEGYESAALFNDQWDDTKRVFNSLWMSANTTILPMLTGALTLLEDVVIWVRQNQDLVEGFFIGVAGVITAMYLPAIASAASATLIAAAPFLLIGAAITAVGVAVAIAYEDIKAWVNGGESLIGDYLGSFEDFKEGVDSALDVVKDSFQAFKDFLFGIFDAISEQWDGLTGGIKETADDISGFFSDLFGDDDDAEVNQTIENTTKATQTMGIYGTNPMNQGGYSYITQPTSNYNVNVGGANIDARGMSKEQAQSAFGESLKQQVEMAVGQVNDGIDR